VLDQHVDLIEKLLNEGKCKTRENKDKKKNGISHCFGLIPY
jgi:hypothetical protein